MSRISPRARIRAAVSALALLVVVAAAVLNSLLQMRLSVGIDDLQEIPTAVPMDPVALNLSLDDALKGTHYYRNWTLNRPTPTAALNIVIFDSLEEAYAGRLATGFRNNAVYLADANAIAIDYQLVHTLWRRYFPSDESWGSRANLLSWIVGHEVGHLVRGDRTSHFQAGSLLKPRVSCRGTASERAADEYYAAMVLGWDTESRLGQVELFQKILEAELLTSQSQPRVKARSFRRWFQRLTQRCTHPEFLIRAFRFIAFIARHSDDPELQTIAAELEARIFTY